MSGDEHGRNSVPSEAREQARLSLQSKVVSVRLHWQLEGLGLCVELVDLSQIARRMEERIHHVARGLSSSGEDSKDLVTTSLSLSAALSRPSVLDGIASRAFALRAFRSTKAARRKTDAVETRFSFEVGR